MSKRIIIFIILLGLVSLLADVTYEGARSIYGPFFAELGASAALVGFVAGLGELISLGLRLVFGFLADKTRAYWPLTIVGYAINLLSVPLLGLARGVPMACFLVITERFGKAVRTPARDAMLSFAASRTGRGFAFGLHEAMDQIGAAVGPLFVATVVFYTDELHKGFMVLGVPALLALLILMIARFLFRSPETFETPKADVSSKALGKKLVLYLVAASFVGFGYLDFPLLAFHFQKTEVLSVSEIPLVYAFAMGVDAVSALVFGRFFDKIGLGSLALAIIVALPFPALVFLHSPWLVLAGIFLWGVGMGALESILRAGVGAITPPERRGFAFGLFNSVFGLSWFLGSVCAGVLYDHGVLFVTLTSVVAMAVGVALFLVSSGVKE